MLYKEEADLFRRITTTEVTNEKRNQVSISLALNRSQRGVMTWKETLKNLSQGAATLLEKAYRHESQSETPCVEQENWHRCALKLYFFKCMYVARIGRLDPL